MNVKRILSAVLAFCMVLSMVNVGVFADETEQDFVLTAEENEAGVEKELTVCVGESVTFTAQGAHEEPVLLYADEADAEILEMEYTVEGNVLTAELTGLTAAEEPVELLFVSGEHVNSLLVTVEGQEEEATEEAKPKQELAVASVPFSFASSPSLLDAYTDEIKIFGSSKSDKRINATISICVGQTVTVHYTGSNSSSPEFKKESNEYVIHSNYDGNGEDCTFTLTGAKVTSNAVTIRFRGYNALISGNDQYAEVYVTVTNHNYEQNVKTVLPTCTDKGYTRHECSCGLYEDREYVDPLGHSFKDYIYQNDATCMVNGSSIAECENGCGTTNKIEAQGTRNDDLHEYGDATDTNDGLHHLFVCKHNSEHKKYEEHHMDAEIVKQFSATEAGLIKYTCTLCGATETKEIPATGVETYDIIAEPTKTVSVGSRDNGSDWRTMGGFVFWENRNASKTICKNQTLNYNVFFGQYAGNATPNHRDVDVYYADSKPNYWSNSVEGSTNNNTNVPRDSIALSDKSGTKSNQEHSGKLKVSNIGTVVLYAYSDRDNDYVSFLTVTVKEHTWQNHEWNYSQDGKTCTVTAECKDCGTKATKTVNCDVVTKTPAKCTIPGVSKSTAAGLSSSNFKEFPIATKGHNFDGAVWYVTDGNYSTHYRDCVGYGAVACDNGAGKTVSHTANFDVPVFTWAANGFTATASRTCKTCGIVQNLGSATVSSEVTKQATCIATGIRTYTAKITVDGTTYTGSNTKTETIAKDANAHNSKNLDEVPATCTKAGSKSGTVCEYCGTVLSGGGEIPAKGHSWGTVTFTWNGTSSATASHSCTVDGCNATESTSATITSKEKTPATCTEKGWTTYTATAYGATNSKDVQDVALKAHSGQKVEAAAPKCEEAGAKEYWTCTVCRKNFSNAACTSEITDLTAWKNGAGKVNPTGHAVGTLYKEQKAATCTEDGVKFNVCSCANGCGKYLKDANTVVTAADWTAAKLGHPDKVHHDKKEATCTEDGIKEYWSCSKCAKNFADQDCNSEITDLVISKLGHDYSVFKTNGSDTHTPECSRCHVTTSVVSHTAPADKDANWNWLKVNNQWEANVSLTCPDCNETYSFKATVTNASSTERLATTEEIWGTIYTDTKDDSIWKGEVTVKYVPGMADETKSYNYLTLKKVTAPATNEEGKAFKGWYEVKKDSEGTETFTRVSTKRSYSFFVTRSNIVLAPRYEGQELVIEVKPDVNISIEAGEATQARISLTWSLPSGYKLEEAGIYRLTKKSDGAVDKKVLLDNAIKYVSALKKSDGTYVLNVKNAISGYYQNAMGYIIYTTPNGERVQVETDIVFVQIK